MRESEAEMLALCEELGIGLRALGAAGSGLVESEKLEIRLYERYRDYVSYGYYIARKVHRGP